MRSSKILSAIVLLAAACAADPILFAYFKDNGQTGVFFALSEDGFHFKSLNGGAARLVPSHPGELMRDPHIARGTDGEFHMVWTWDWRGPKIGYAHSRDLIHWSEQREIPLMAQIPGAQNTWAPEIYWVAEKSKWLIIWSSTAEGRDGHRVYSTLTTDFRTFDKPTVFFDPCYNVIDATILHARDRYYLVFKDEREQPLHKEIKIAEGPSIEGPWSNISRPITGAWSEGPSILEIGGKYVVYYDHYRDPKHYEAVESADLAQWKAVAVEFPAGARHGSFLRITAEEARRLR